MTTQVWSVEALRVLALLCDGRRLHGWAVSQATGLKVGTVYPMLKRFAAQGLVISKSEWAAGIVDPSLHSGSPRVFYQLSTQGRDQVEALRSLLAGST